MRSLIEIAVLNPVGGVDHFFFTGYKDHIIDVSDSGETKKNLFAQWPKSYGAHADTITRQTYRRTKKQQVIRSQPLTATQAQEMGEQIKSSPVVQIIVSRRDRRTVLVDTGSVVVRKEKDKMHALSFTITFTDEYPGQTV